MIGDEDEPPYIPLVGLGDVNTGVHGALAVLAALRHRDRTGRGQHLDVALLDVYYHFHEINVHQVRASGGKVKPTRVGRHIGLTSALGGVFRATGGHVVIMGFFHHWPDLCRAMERPELIEDPLYSTDLARLERRDEVVKLIEDWCIRFLMSPVRSLTWSDSRFQSLQCCQSQKPLNIHTYVPVERFERFKMQCTGATLMYLDSRSSFLTSPRSYP